MVTSLKKEKVSSEGNNRGKALDFIAAGVACYAFSLIDELGLLEQLLSDDGLSPNSFCSYPNPLVIRTAIQTLECNDIVFLDKRIFRLTSFGKNLARHRSSIGLIYNGYRKVLSNQLILAQDQPWMNRDLMDEMSISKASAQMGDKFFIDNLLTILKKYSIKGTVCDLGCGNASTLMYLCRKAKLQGLGFDYSSSSIETAKSRLNRDDAITLLAQDINNISKVYPEVEALLQSFVMHDFPNNLCKKLLKSLVNQFPEVKIFLYVDAVAPEAGESFQLPGFDYVHSLFGLKPRTSKETSKLLMESGFNILDQEPIFGLTNCYIWTLCYSEKT